MEHSIWWHCHGVLYHEMHPLALLQHLRAMLSDDGTLLFGSMMLADAELSEYARFVPHAYYGDPTWWWVPGRLAMRWMLEAAGLEVEETFGLSDGPPGEFATVNGYYRAQDGAGTGRDFPAPLETIGRCRYSPEQRFAAGDCRSLANTRHDHDE
jgi:hypothetical protein